MLRFRSVLVLAGCALFLLCGAARADKRVALVVGNDRYANLPAEMQLQKAVNDAQAVGDQLAKLGFTVVRGQNLTRQAMIDKLSEFTTQIEPGDTAAVFYAGHGVAIGGINYLVMSDVPAVTPDSELRVRGASVAEGDIVSEIQSRGARVSLLVLDACRDNPFPHTGTRAIGNTRGLADAKPARGVFTVYSAGIGQTALDRLEKDDPNPNSVFTRVFVQSLAVPNMSLGDMIIDVREKVADLAMKAKNDLGQSEPHEQTPAYYDQTIGGRVYLAPRTASLESAPANPPPATTAPQSAAPGQQVRGTAPSDPATECDRLASSPLDPQRPPNVAGIEASRIDHVPALAACDAATVQHPDVARFFYQRGRVADAQQDYETSLRVYTKAADLGSAAAMNNIGALYGNGNLGKADYNEQRKWLERSAAAGLTLAMKNLGDLYQSGEGITQDYAQARQWYEKAAALNSGLAMVALGQMSKDGHGVSKDLATARQWDEKAAALGDASGMNALGDLYYSGDGVAQNYTEARKWYEKAAALDSTPAMSSLGVMYRDAQGVSQDYAEAKKWFEKSVASDDAFGMDALGDLYEYGEGVAQDYAEARKWYEKAATAGDSDGMLNLGRLYQDGLGGAKDVDAALDWYKQSAALGNADAQKKLDEQDKSGSRKSSKKKVTQRSR